MYRLLLLLLFLPATPLRAEGLAMLRPVTVVEDPMVRLGDLFEGIGPRAETVLGPAPAPGQRQVVEAAQLMSIARLYGIAWRPIGGNDRVVLERPGRPVPREEVRELLRSALRSQGVSEEAEIELQGFTPPLVPASGPVDLTMEQAVLDGSAGRYVATLAITAEGMPTFRMRLAGRVTETVPVLVAARRLQAGAVLAAADMRQMRVPVSRLRAGAVQEPEQAVGFALRRPAAPEQPLFVADLTVPTLIDRGETVTMLYEIPGMVLTARGRALESGQRGGVVPVMNLTSRVVVEAEVVSPGRVRVRPRR